MKRNIMGGVLCCALAAGQVAQAQQLVYTVVVPAGKFGSANFLKLLTGQLVAIQAFCRGLPDESFRVDCLAERLGAVVGEIPKGTDYDEIRGVVAQASDKLARLARSNMDRSKGRVRASSATDSSQVATRPLSAVKVDRLAAVNIEATAILEEARTMLLRSATSGVRKTQYQRVAQALDSNKLLLRS